MKKLLVTGLAGMLAAGFAVAAFAQTGAKTEISTAHAHALMAQGAATVDMSHTHLHHVINCLVGPNGKGFDASAGNPCKDQGHGAIPDSASDKAVHGKLEKALAGAQAGLKSDSLAGAQQAGAKVAATLQDIGSPAKKASGGYSW